MCPMSTKIERLTIPGPMGELEAMFESGSASRPRSAALVCHPHPLHGGSLHNKVVFRAAKTALQVGLPTLRFNFRGVGKSEGQFSDGIGEREDVRAALDFLEERFRGVSICLIGFSFGAWVGLSVGAVDERVRALIGLGLPCGGAVEDRPGRPHASPLQAAPGFLADIAKPKLLIYGTHDPFAPRVQVEALFAEMAETKRLCWIERADHFFTGRLDDVQSVLRAYLQELLEGRV